MWMASNLLNSLQIGVFMPTIDIITNTASFPQSFIFNGDDVTLQSGEIYRIPEKQRADAAAMLETKHGKALVDMGFLYIGATKSGNRTEAKTPEMPEELKQPASGTTTKVKSAGSVKV
jgi:hypothetical protein